MSFSSLGLNQQLISTINKLNYTEPTPIQSEAIPHILAGHDIMARAQTGTGKTAAFALPLLHLIKQPLIQKQATEEQLTPDTSQKTELTTLVLTPTRVADNAKGTTRGVKEAASVAGPTVTSKAVPAATEAVVLLTASNIILSERYLFFS